MKTISNRWFDFKAILYYCWWENEKWMGDATEKGYSNKRKMKKIPWYISLGRLYVCRIKILIKFKVFVRFILFFFFKPNELLKRNKKHKAAEKQPNIPRKYSFFLSFRFFFLFFFTFLVSNSLVKHHDLWTARNLTSKKKKWKAMGGQALWIK